MCKTHENTQHKSRAKGPDSCPTFFFGKKSPHVLCSDSTNSNHSLQPLATPLKIQIERIPKKMDGEEEEPGKKKGKEILQENLLQHAALQGMLPIPSSPESQTLSL
jgi:hypothetical protein